MTKTIPLSRGRAYALVSNVDYDYLTQWTWFYTKSNGYAQRYDNSGYSRKRIWMHRAIMARILGYPIPAGAQVDHINLDSGYGRRDNRRENLRLTTRSQNQWHKGIPANSTTGYKGVSKKGSRFIAYIKVNKQRIHLGTFADVKEAALMRDWAGLQLHGEAYTVRNIPNEPIPEWIKSKFRKVLAKRKSNPL